ncbi:MAG: gamma-glutamyltransferase, partial [Chromatiales bacterium]|nr:gamma-glutamyltransferase [Chromatiales bacterium]
LYSARGLTAIPSRGPLAANTVAGTVSGWGDALRISQSLGGHLPLERLLEDAIHYAEHGVPVTVGQQSLTKDKLGEMEGVCGFSQFLSEGKPYQAGQLYRNERLAETLRAIAADGTETFYRGALATKIAADLSAAGSPVTAADLAAHTAQRVTPLKVDLPGAQLFNMPPPTQGISSLMILALFDQLQVREAEGFAHLHGIVEATKQAFLVRDKYVTDPAYMTRSTGDLLAAPSLHELAGAIDPEKALPWPQESPPGDTIWMGAIDRDGVAVSFIQSIYWEFGSGVVLGETGIQWQNRGSSFSLHPDALHALRPGRKPFHTLNPAMAMFDDGRTLSYGTMGGEGQPQTQAAVFSRYHHFGQPLQQAVSAPRWLLGRTWGEQSTNLKVESRIDSGVLSALRLAGHDVQVVEPYTSMMGHAGAVLITMDGTLEGATDPRSDGVVAAF